MELPVSPHDENGHARVRTEYPPRVVIAFDQLTVEEQRQVTAALSTLDRDGLAGSIAALGIVRLAGAEPLYALRAAPEVWMIMRAEPGAAIEVVDIMRPAALRNFAHAAR
jgi:hypothetical protein